MAKRKAIAPPNNTPEQVFTLFGRPTIYDQAKANQICEDVSNGHSIVRACTNAEINRTTVYSWLEHKPEFLTAFTRARQLQAHSLADDCLEIAERCTQQDANAARVHIETKWRMAGRMNAIYNDKVVQELTGANGGPIATQVDTTQLAAMSIEQLRALSGREDEPK